MTLLMIQLAHLLTYFILCLYKYKNNRRTVTRIKNKLIVTTTPLTMFATGTSTVNMPATSKKLDEIFATFE